jgi:hypothetical protein
MAGFTYRLERQDRTPADRRGVAETSSRSVQTGSFAWLRFETTTQINVRRW